MRQRSCVDKSVSWCGNDRRSGFSNYHGTGAGLRGSCSTCHSFCDFSGTRESDVYAAKVNIIDTPEMVSYLASTTKTDAGTDTLLFRVSAVPNLLRPQFLQLARILHPGATQKDGAQLGTKRSQKLMQDTLDNLSALNIQPVPLQLPRDEAEPEEEKETIQHLLAELVREVKQDKATRMETPGGKLPGSGMMQRASPLTPLERRARKQARTKRKSDRTRRQADALSSSSSTRAPVIDREALLRAMQAEASESEESETATESYESGDDGTDGGPNLPPLNIPMAQPAGVPVAPVIPANASALVAQAMRDGMTTEQETAGWAQITDMQNVVVQMLPQFKPCSDSQKEKYSDDDVFKDCGAVLKPRNPAGPNDTCVTVTPKDLGAFAYLF